MSKKLQIVTPNSTILERTALSIAAEWYEIGRGQGLTSKWPNARAYAKANLERFLPNAVSILLDMLKPDSNCTEEMREAIYLCLMERHNDPDLLVHMPNIDVAKVLKIAEETERAKGGVVIQEPKKTIFDKDFKQFKQVKNG